MTEQQSGRAAVCVYEITAPIAQLITSIVVEAAVSKALMTAQPLNKAMLAIARQVALIDKLVYRSSIS